jgi:hypothetical protein
MTTTVKLKNSVITTNAPSSLQQGEVAINITDRKVWVGNAATTPVQLIGDGSSFNNLSYTGTLTGGTGIVNIGLGQFYKDASGNIGLGTTTPTGVGATYRNLVIVGSAGGVLDLNDSSGTVRGTVSTDNSGGNALFIDTRTVHPIVFRPNVNEAMRITSGGNVGIGTNSPAQKFVVSNGGQQGVEIVPWDGTFSYIQGYNRNTSALNPFAILGSDIRFWTNGSERMRIVSNGDVGIGTTSPSGKLTIAGTTPLYVETTYGAFAFRDISTTGQELHIRPYQGKNGFVTFTENAVDDRWVFGIEAGNSSLLFKSGSASSNTNRMSLTSAGVLQFDSGYGSVATAYGCRSWVNFNGSGTVAIRASGNVSSITDNAAGDYTVNFATAIVDANYSWTFGGSNDLDDTSNKSLVAITTTSYQTAGSLRILTKNLTGGGGQGNGDSIIVNIAVFR